MNKPYVSPSPLRGEDKGEGCFISKKTFSRVQTFHHATLQLQ